MTLIRVVAASAVLTLVASGVAQRLPGELPRPGQSPGGWVVELRPGASAELVAGLTGTQIVRRFVSDPNRVVLRASPGRAVAASLMATGFVVAAKPNQPVRLFTRAFVPNDPLYAPSVANGYAGQWSLTNTAVPEMDVNLVPAWNRDLTGAGVLLGIVDDGVQTGHPDLIQNLSAANSWDFTDNDNDPNPGSVDDHGTAVAGVSAARGGNAIGVTGAAPRASIAAIRLASLDEASWADALLWRSSARPVTIRVKNHSYGVRGNYVAVPTVMAALRQSAEAGVIHVWASGNFRNSDDGDIGKFMVESSPYVVNVAALGSSGVYADYSSYGASILVTAPSSSYRAGELGIATTDRTSRDEGYNGNEWMDGDYTGDFGGTSAAAPLVAGVLALAAQAQPNLEVRMAKHLLVRTSVQVDPTDSSVTSDGGWRTNGAGFKFNPNYGFGLIDADALTREAVKFSGVTPLETETGTANVGRAIPDDSPTGVQFTFNVARTTPLEEVVITLAATHPQRGQLEATLRSPSGTVSRLFTREPQESGADLNWAFTANAFWGENPQGTWTVTVRDLDAGESGTWNTLGWEMRMGSLVPASPLGTLTVAPTSLVGGASATGTVTLTTPAPNGGLAVALTSSNAAATVPSEVTVPQGATRADFPITTRSVADTTAVTVRASHLGTERTANLTLLRVPSNLLRLTISPAVVTAPTGARGTVLLDRVSPDGGTTVALASNSPFVRVPASVLIPKGYSGMAFNITTSVPGATVNATVIATLRSVSRTATLQVLVPVPEIVSFVMSPPQVVGNGTTNGTLTLRYPAPAAGVRVTLTSSNAAVRPPSSVLIPAGTRALAFRVPTVAVSRDVLVTVRAAVGTSVRTASVSVLAPLVASLSVTPTSARGGTTLSGLVTLGGRAPTGGVTVTLSSTNSVVRPPASVNVPAGSTAVRFAIPTVRTGIRQSATIRAVRGPSSQSAAVVLQP